VFFFCFFFSLCGLFLGGVCLLFVGGGGGGPQRVVDEGDFWKMPNNTSFFISDQWPV
jgi:hypothetical protein